MSSNIEIERRMNTFTLNTRLIGFHARVGPYKQTDGHTERKNILSLALIVDESSCEEAKFSIEGDL